MWHMSISMWRKPTERIALAQFLSEMPHGRKNESDLLFVMANVCRLLRHLGHDDDIAFGVETSKRRDIMAELVAEDQN